MGLGLDQLRQIQTYFVTILNDPAHYLSRDGDIGQITRRTTSSTTKVAGLIASPNIELVSSSETFASAVARARTSVVNISCERITETTDSSTLKFDDPAQDLVNFGGIGSGIIISPKGYILTCYHIIAQASNIVVTPFGSVIKRYPAQVVAVDQGLNLAILKIYPAAPLIAATLGDSGSMEVADSVLAIGNPFGLEQSVTHGIISDTKRDLMIQGNIIKNMIQTDVPINRGSSGGPLINTNGEVIGINMAIYSPTGVYIGVSFALPLNQAKLLLARNIQ
ncbi:Putative magnetosome protein MamE restricted to the trypsin-like domain (N-terminus of MamE), without the double heme binding site (CXXCH) and the 2 PDZ-serine protease domains [Desulfamplus magnetovallimortis]|uniref:Magnetosome protein n=3 Tax=Desulfamplus magnetovallimortis TaxID=1246637 RepID=G8IQT9_9BACT|nr:magnetosome protein [Desulfamplus magnetovallimortis BW-1]CCO06706.1 Putative magnetosome protein MamE restricted to the trypsin-like domain (N-terminus of MamE), without the double heme binding site (CXXCH) and the 2 PDZ-serine protease domains [Desulfamplus magnetovallimortis BW-1]SLM32757.1 Putative magnetosome protein MamE restricted to the trypsin-like domain (N-terminus of MamE), without the double heme binding site (CXXCH) and the 2 PDZ-serine protease domains [Desulfamplus magnetovalli